MTTTLKLLTTTAIATGYLIVAWASAHPQVTPEYAAHFLQRTAECWYSQPEVIPQAVIDVGMLSYPGACRYLRWGWLTIEDWGVWSNTHGARLAIPPRPGARAAVLTFRSPAVLEPLLRIRFSWDDHELEEIVSSGSTLTITLPFRPDETHAINVQIVTLDRITFPANVRQVGIGLVRISYL